MKRIISLKPNETVKQAPKRAFLTQKSSWVKLASFVGIFILGGWFVFKPNTPQKDIQVANNSQGKVAGVETSRPESNQQNPSNVFSTQTGNDHISGGGENEDTKTTVVDKQAEVKPEEPSAAALASTKLIGAENINDLMTLLNNGKKYLDSNQLSQADSLFTRATEIAPEYRTAWYLLGYTQLKEYEKNPITTTNKLNFAQKALITLTRAHSIDPLAKNVNTLLEIAQKAVADLK